MPVGKARGENMSVIEKSRGSVNRSFDVLGHAI